MKKLISSLILLSSLNAIANEPKVHVSAPIDGIIFDTEIDNDKSLLAFKSEMTKKKSAQTPIGLCLKGAAHAAETLRRQSSLLTENLKITISKVDGIFSDSLIVRVKYKGIEKEGDELDLNNRLEHTCSMSIIKSFIASKNDHKHDKQADVPQKATEHSHDEGTH